jgi:biopolymer transport protein ExbD
MAAKVASRAQLMRETRRAQQFAKFRLVHLNLVPLVDTFVSIVFFALTTATVGELAPIANGVTLPEAGVGAPAHQQLTLAVASSPANIVFNGQPVMSVAQAASAQSNYPGQPLAIPALFATLKATADSIRQADKVAADESVETPLAIQGDRTMRYDMLSRILQTARLAGFKNVTLQVKRAGVSDDAAPSTT